MKSAVIQNPTLSSFGRQESVCKVKPESCYYCSGQEAKIDMDRNVHGYCGDSPTDTIQYLLYTEAQPVKTGDNGWPCAAGELGEGILESLHLQLPQLS